MILHSIYYAFLIQKLLPVNTAGNSDDAQFSLKNTHLFKNVPYT